MGVRQNAVARRGTRVRRERVVPAGASARLADAARKPIALVIAPTGHGKTALLRRLIAERERTYFVDAAAGEGTFRDAVRGLCESLRAIAFGARLTFASSYARAAQSGRHAAVLSRWLGRYLENREVTLVFDAVDRLGGEVPILAELVERLVSESDGRVRAVLASRDDAGLPVPRWFASDLCGMPLGAEDLEPAADGAPDAEALFGDLDRAERAYVLRTCLLRSFDEPVLRALGVAQHPLLAASPLRPLIDPDGTGGYRYDEHVRALAERALRADPTAYREIAEATVDALEAAGRVRAALDAARAASLVDHVRRLLRAHGSALEEHGDLDAIEAALDVLPVHDDDPVVLLLRATREARLGRSDMAEAWFRHVIERADSRDVSVDAAYRLARELIRRDRPDAVELLEPYADDEMLAPEQRASVLSVLAQAYVVAQRPGEARRAIGAALACSETLEAATRSYVYTRAAYVELYCGEIERAREHAALGASIAEDARLDVVAFGAYSVLYNLLYDADGPSASLRCLERLADCAIRSGNVDFHLYAMVAAYELQVERGDVVAVERLDHGLRAFDLHYGAAPSLEGLLPSRALVTAWAGRFAAAYDLLAPSGEQQLRFPDRVALRWAEIALYAAAAGMREAAADALAFCVEAAQRDDSRSHHVLRARVIAAVAAELAGVPAEPLPPMPTPRLAALARAADIVVARYRGEAGGAEILAALAVLREHEFGGLAKLFAALPLRTA